MDSVSAFARAVQKRFGPDEMDDDYSFVMSIPWLRIDPVDDEHLWIEAW